MLKKTIAIASLLLASAFLLTACGNAAKLPAYELGSDKVPSVYAVIGEERKVTGVSAGTSNGVQYKEYTYETASMLEDLVTYTKYLRDNGWLVTEAYNLETGSGTAQLATQSADAGKILIMSIEFKLNSYTIKIEKGAGTLS